MLCYTDQIFAAIISVILDGVFGYRENEPLAIEEWDLWLWESLALAEWESLAMEEWNGVASLGRGLGASRGLVGSSRLNFSRSLS